MRELKTPLLSSSGLVLLAFLVVPYLATLGCYSAPSGTGSGGSPGSGGQTSGSGGATASGGATGSGGTTSGGSGGTTAGSGGATTGSGGTTTGSGGAVVGSGGSTGSGGQTGTGGRGSGGSTGTGGTGTGGRGTGGAGTGGAASGGRTGNLRIMLLGDSTTSSICFRSYLWQMLTQAGHTQFDFIGTRKGDPGCSFTGYDQDNEGHGGYIVTDILKATTTGRPSGADPTDLFDASAKDLATWFDGHPADVVLMHMGTNDVWNNRTPQNILDAYTAILTRLRTVNPNVRVFVAQITPLNPSGCSTCNPGVQALNAAIPAWATQKTTTQSPIAVVDQFTNFTLGTDSVDGVHATNSGSMKIATKWYNAIVPLF